MRSRVWTRSFSQPGAALIRATRSALACLPTVCLLCGRHTRQAYSLCEGCERDLPLADNVCLRCGTPMPHGNSHTLCGACLLNPPTFDRCQGAMIYAGAVRGLITRFKFDANLSAGYALSLILARQMQTHYARGELAPDCLLPVPLHRARRRHRGFNQAREIARVLADQCDIPVQDHRVRRRRNTPAQSSQSSKLARRRNLAGAFEPGPATNSDAVRSIAIVDDVVTTTATVEAMSRCLKKQGIARIEVWCLARARL